MVGRNDGLRRCPGFSLPELLICLGVIALLVAIAAPLLGRSRDRARQVASMSGVKQSATIVLSYCADSYGVFPIAHENPFSSSRMWEHLLTRTGHLPSPQAADYTSSRSLPGSQVDLSVCLMYDADRMMMGRTVPIDQARCVPIMDAQVPYPADKGMLLLHCTDAIPGSGNCFCCVKIIDVPVAMVDGSAMIGNRTTFVGGDVPVITDGVGEPIFSSWNGYRARDRK